MPKPKTQATGETRTYRVLRGRHNEGNVTYYKGGPDGDVFESNKDILALNGSVPTKKFELVTSTVQKVSTKDTEAGETAPQTVPDDGLEHMTIEELRRHASAEGISLHGATKKEDILATIRAAYNE